MKSPLKDYLKYALSNMVGMAGISCYILADTFFVSKGAGADGLAALNLAIPIYSLIHGCGLMLGMGGGTYYSICKAQNDDYRANRAFIDTILTALIPIVLFLIAGGCFSSQLATLLRANADTFEMTKTYLRILLLFSPAFICNDLFLCFVRNDNNPKLAMIAMLAGSLFNILFDYILIFPLKMGILGAALATGFSPIVGMAILSIHIIQKKNGFHFQKGSPSLKRIFSILSTGLPSFAGEMSAGIVIFVFNGILMSLSGNTGVAAYGIVANIALVVISVFTGAAQGMQPLFSVYYAKNDVKNVNIILLYGVITIGILSVIVYLTAFFGGNGIARIFNSAQDETLQKLSVEGMKLYFISTPFIGWNLCFAMLFSSVKAEFRAHAISLTRGFLLVIPVTFLFSSVWGVTGVWLSVPATEIAVTAAGAILYLLWLRSIKKRGNRL